MMTFSEYVLKENTEIEKKIDGLDYTPNVLGISDQLSNFWKNLSTMNNSKSANTSDIAVDVYEYHWNKAPAKLGTYVIKDYAASGFSVRVTGVGEVEFGKSGRAVDKNLDLFVSNPKFVARR